MLEPLGTQWATLAALGDIGVIGSARSKIARDGWDAAFRLLSPKVQQADVAFANLEFPIGQRDWVREGRSDEFFHETSIAGALVRAGVRVVSLANNHMMDCGPRGLQQTLDACREAGLATIGAGANLAAAREPWRSEVRGRRILMLAYGTAARDAASQDSPGIAPLDAGLVREDIARWRGESDLLVVSAHWGSMYVDYPPPRVLEMAQLFAEAGADLVLGHHPHVLQGVERRGRTLVAYSLGDAVFNCRAGDFHAEVAAQKRLETGVFTVRFAEVAHGIEIDPIRLDDDGLPTRPTPTEAAAALQRWRVISDGLTDAGAAFARESASTLLKYEMQSLATYVRQGRWGRILRLLGQLRLRHVPVLWHAITRRGSGR